MKSFLYSDSELGALYPTSSVPNSSRVLGTAPGAGHSSSVQASDVSTYSREDEIPLNRYHVSHEPGDPPHKMTITLSADLTMEVIETREFALSRRRRAALEEIDGAFFLYVSFRVCEYRWPSIDLFVSLFHLKVCLIAGVGFFTDASVFRCLEHAVTLK